jgi:hypothetical protein
MTRLVVFPTVVEAVNLWFFRELWGRFSSIAATLDYASRIDPAARVVVVCVYSVYATMCICVYVRVVFLLQ